MNTKRYLSTILIFVIFFFTDFSAKSQNDSNTIRVASRGLGSVYYKDNVMLTLNQVKQVTYSTPEAYLLMVKSSNMQVASYIFGCAGGFSLGFSIGHALGSLANRNFNSRLFYSTLIAGLGSISIGIAFEIASHNKAKQGIAIYNNAIKQKNSTNLDLGFSPNGLLLKLNF